MTTDCRYQNRLPCKKSAPIMQHVNVQIDKDHERKVVGQVATQGAAYLGVSPSTPRFFKVSQASFIYCLDLEFMREIATQVGDSTF